MPSTSHTHETVLRYHLAWKHRDLEAILALYHPDVQYNDFFQNRTMGLAELREYVASTLPRHPEEYLEHTDRIRIDGSTAFIQYQTALQGGGQRVVFRSSEAITVRDGLIWRINEYASLVREAPAASTSRAPAISKLGLSARQLSYMARDLDDYFQRQRPFLDPDLDLQAVAAATGYSRNQISYLLNQVLGQSFYRYVNQARVRYLLGRLAEEGEAAPVDALAASAGFNSISAFYKTFRAHTGCTPKAWLQAHYTRTRR
ncbi:nuclear transport factor 2 family protein [Pseudomonas sp. RIT-PI-S]|uniref:helix-turn-helix domain-containing protein n=1 Tax=Pseudomonas sp. RIT-PI-S TaxID=3035295 RepID=UPI0021DA9B3C|nr:nuclear transport factor 2 family protein [Pseudomonas sp. RIT-PI-S]